MTKHLLASALFAGLCAGVVATVLQFFFVLPVLLEGELFETGARVHFSATGSPQSEAGFPTIWTEPMRHLGTFGFNIITYCGFAMFMVAGFALARRAGHRVDARAGLLWGLAGFAAVHLAPAIGLPPELPGTIASEVDVRQIWWTGCVAATIAGLALLGYGKAWWVWLAGVALILAPHVIGAPRLDTYFGVGPAELGAMFAARSLAVAAVVWAVLGAVAGKFWAEMD